MGVDEMLACEQIDFDHEADWNNIEALHEWLAEEGLGEFVEEDLDTAVLLVVDSRRIWANCEGRGDFFHSSIWFELDEDDPEYLGENNE